MGINDSPEHLLEYQRARRQPSRLSRRALIICILGSAASIVVVWTIVSAARTAHFAKAERGEEDRILEAVCGRDSRSLSLTLVKAAANTGFGPRRRWFQFKCSTGEMATLKASVLGHAPLIGWKVENPASEASLQLGKDPEWWNIRQDGYPDILGVHQPGGASFWFIFCAKSEFVFMLYDSH
jgi:hypothetical protein